jgi:hypothetical protein
MAKPLTTTEVVALITIMALIVAVLAYIGFAIWAEPIAKVNRQDWYDKRLYALR